LRELRKANSSTIVNEKIIHLISNPENLTAAYESIKSSSGNMTPGSDGLTLDGTSFKLLQKISKDLKAGKFEFSPVRRVYVPKRNKNELRPLAVVSPRDKIVQTAILKVLEAIFEPSFCNSSHGFRLGRGCHTALNSLKQQFGGVTWAIEGDILKCYDSINHDILLSLIRKRINCEKTISLIKRMLKTPYKDNGKTIRPNVGIFQGNSVSPLLCNIYLHELDLFLENVKKSFDKEKRRRKNPQYRKIQYLMSKKSLTREEKLNLSKKLRALNSKDPYDTNFRRLHYIRYADDFVIGIIGTKRESRIIWSDLRRFLNESLLLTLNLNKTHISHFNSDGVLFLGTSIRGNHEKEKVVRTVKKGNLTVKVRTTSRTRLSAPIESILKRAYENGFFKRKQSKIFVPTACRRLVNMDHADIINFYNQKIRGILNYYSFADNKKSLGSIVHGFKHSCALTLALKYQLRRRSKVFKKFGKTLKCPLKGKELFIPKTFQRDQKFSVNPNNPGEILDIRWNNKLTRSNLHKSCLIYGAFPSEMHHVRKIRDLQGRYRDKKLDFWTMQMAAINRKQIPLCSEHHKLLHRNKLSLEERENLSENIKNFR
jgi:group II intron reverse transcriptase/maturase